MMRKRRAINGNKKMLAPIATILIVLLVSSMLLIMTGPGMSYAIDVNSGDCGLVVTASGELVDVTNLNPGDNKASYLIAENTKDMPLTYYFDIQKVGSLNGFYRGLIGKPLDEVLQITVKRGGVELFHGMLEDFVELDMGVLGGGESQQIDIAVSLYGPDVGNEYQGASVTVRFMFRSECTGTGTLDVRKFRDNNRNGVWDPGEPEILNWKVYINGEEYTTPVIGLQLEPGTYTVTEETRNGWIASTDISKAVIVEKGKQQTVLFGNYPRGSSPQGNSLTVRKFNDLDGDGTWDSGEPEIQGWPVTINGHSYTTPVFLYDLSPGRYQVVEEDRDGWESTTDTAVTVPVPATGDRTVIFGNRQLPTETDKATLTVRKFFDLNENGTWDEGEWEILDWKVFIDGVEYSTPLTHELEPGTYTVREETREVDGWTATTATEAVVVLEAGENETVLFGNYHENEIILPPELPRTGELPPYYFYGAGLLLFLAGILLGRKKYSFRVK
jgi:LPXTG-motif cell wall-anchored protein